MSVSLVTMMFTAPTQCSKLGSQVVNGPAIDVSTHREGITHKGILLSVLISVLSPYQSSFCPPPQPQFAHPHIPRPWPARAIVEMSSATFACILTTRDGVDSWCLPDSLIHQLSAGRSLQGEGEVGETLVLVGLVTLCTGLAGWGAG